MSDPYLVTSSIYEANIASSTLPMTSDEDQQGLSRRRILAAVIVPPPKHESRATFPMHNNRQGSHNIDITVVGDLPLPPARPFQYVYRSGRKVQLRGSFPSVTFSDPADLNWHSDQELEVKKEVNAPKK